MCSGAAGVVRHAVSKSKRSVRVKITVKIAKEATLRLRFNAGRQSSRGGELMKRRVFDYFVEKSCVSGVPAHLRSILHKGGKQRP